MRTTLGGESARTTEASAKNTASTRAVTTNSRVGDKANCRRPQRASQTGFAALRCWEETDPETSVSRSFDSLSEREVLALAISLEEEDARIYEDLAAALQKEHPQAAAEVRKLRADEDGHRHRLLDLFRRRFGDHVPLVRRQHVRGFVHR